MQLIRRRALPLLAASLALADVSFALAQGDARATATMYYEPGGAVHTRVITPAVTASGTIRDTLTIRAGWEADIVSGASVAVVDAPTAEVDAITSATTYDDFRNTVRGGLSLVHDLTTLDASYAYGKEKDYQSHSFRLNARTELFERNTIFEVGYARAFDGVCTLRQPNETESVDRQRLPSSDGCFGGDERETRDLSIQTFQGSWSQAWTPIFVTQLTLTAQIQHGFQANPYRAVWIGRTSAQENHPRERARYSANLGTRFWLKPLSSALQLDARLYRDTWNVRSLTLELAYEQTVRRVFRINVRGRYYNQGSATFYSDDYVLAPRGQYFTGDRELSAMQAWTVGGRMQWSIPPGDDGKVGFFNSLDFVVKGDFVLYDFDAFHYGQVRVPNDSGIIATLSLESTF
jgi:hypothetical protein